MVEKGRGIAKKQQWHELPVMEQGMEAARSSK
jgi:hypothetical protein